MKVIVLNIIVLNINAGNQSLLTLSVQKNINEKIQSMLNVGTTKGTICVEYFRFKKRSTPAPSKGFQQLFLELAIDPLLSGARCFSTHLFPFFCYYEKKIFNHLFFMYCFLNKERVSETIGMWTFLLLCNVHGHYKNLSVDMRVTISEIFQRFPPLSVSEAGSKGRWMGINGQIKKPPRTANNWN